MIFKRLLHSRLLSGVQQYSHRAARTFSSLSQRSAAKLRSAVDRDIAAYERILGGNFVKTTDLEGYNEDWLHMHRGQSAAVLLPASWEEVSEVLKYSHRERIPLVVQSGNTSLVAGSVPQRDEVILSMSRMNQIEGFDEATGVLNCQAGCVLQTVEEYLSDRGHSMPYDLGAKGSCLVGGNVATNAGGIHFIKHGSLHGSVLGMRVILADGTPLDLRSSLRKDNTGYDLKQIFIGSEGTLGVITDLNILCPIKPKGSTVAFVGLESFQKLVDLLALLRREASEYLNAFEMLDADSMTCSMKNLDLHHPIARPESPDGGGGGGDGQLFPFYALFELAGNDPVHVEERVTSLLERSLSDGLTLDGTLTSTLSAAQRLWSYRERMAEALLRDGYVYKYDFSLPLAVFYDLVPLMREKLAPLMTGGGGGGRVTRVCGYGHVGDQNLHFNVSSPAYDPEVLAAIEPFVYEWVAGHRGSISAEHGLGLKKRNDIFYSRSADAVHWMARLKDLFDPNGILGPQKLLPDRPTRP